MQLYLQPSMFTADEAPPLLGELTVALVDGTYALGASVHHLVTLEPVAITAEPGLRDVDERAEAHAALDVLLDALEQLHQGGPFRATSGASDAG